MKKTKRILSFLKNCFWGLFSIIKNLIIEIAGYLASIATAMMAIGIAWFFTTLLMIPWEASPNLFTPDFLIACAQGLHPAALLTWKIISAIILGIILIIIALAIIETIWDFIKNAWEESAAS